MEKTTPKKLKKIINTTRIVVVQWDTPRCIPCKNQSIQLDRLHQNLGIGKKNKLTKKDVRFVQINIDDYHKEMKKQGIKDMFPAVSIYRDGKIQPFNDTKFNGKIMETIYVKRPNISDFVKNTLKTAKMLK